MRIAALIIICVIVFSNAFCQKKLTVYAGVARVLNPGKIKEPLCKDEKLPFETAYGISHLQNS